MRLNRRLLTLEDPYERLTALCQLVISPEFHGSMSVALRVAGTTVVKVLSGPHRPTPGDGSDAPSPYVSRTVLNTLRETGEPVLASNLPNTAANLELTISSDVLELSAIACPLRQDDRSMDLLYVTLPPQFGTDEWLALMALAAEAHSHAEAAW